MVGMKLECQTEKLSKTVAEYTLVTITCSISLMRRKTIPALRLDNCNTAIVPARHKLCTMLNLDKIVRPID